MRELSNISGSTPGTLPTLQGIDANTSLVQQFAQRFLDKDGNLDSSALGMALGQLAQSDPQLAQAIRQDLLPQLSSMRPLEQGQFDYQFNANPMPIIVRSVML